MQDRGNNHGMIQLEVQYRLLSPAWSSLQTPVSFTGTGELHVTNSVQPVLSQRSHDRAASHASWQQMVDCVI